MYKAFAYAFFLLWVLVEQQLRAALYSIVTMVAHGRYLTVRVELNTTTMLLDCYCWVLLHLSHSLLTANREPDHLIEVLSATD